MKLFVAATTLTLGLISTASAQEGRVRGTPIAPKALQTGDTFELTADQSSLRSVEGKSLEKTFSYTHEYASYMSLHFASTNLAEGCALRITEGKGEYESMRVTGSGKARFAGQPFWGHHVKGDTIEVTLSCESEERLSESGFVVDRYAAGYARPSKPRTRRNLFSDGRALSICGADDKENAVCFEGSHPREYAKSRAVARLSINGSSACTGWLVKSTNGNKNLLLTNNHCINTQSDVLNSDFEFMGEEDTCDSTTGDCFLCDRGTIYDGAQLLYTDEGMDVSLIQLNDDTVDMERIYGAFILDSSEIDLAQQIFIPQHPGARAKEIGLTDSFSSTSECKILGFRNGCTDSSIQDVLYTCDTEGGSSGSPVVDRDTLSAIAIHHCGGGCNGNMGIPANLWYPFIRDYIGDPTPTISPAPTGPAPTPSPSVSPTPCAENSFRLDLLTDSYGAEISYTLKDAADATILEGRQLSSNAQYDKRACVSDGCITFTILDSVGDGICCAYGQGEYKLYYNDALKKTGGEYTNSDTTVMGCDSSETQSI